MDPDHKTPRIAIVTGASSGIGEACVVALLERGYLVYAAARRVEKMKPLEEKGAFTRPLDLEEESSLNLLVSEILAQHDRIDLLINNAGVGLYGAIETVPIKEARRQFEVNLFGLARLTQLVLPGMRKRESGIIVNVSSMGGKSYTPLGAWYHASKHALEGWSDSLRLEAEPLGIKVIIVEPGAVQTEFADQLIEPMKQRSLDTPYEETAEKMAEVTRRTFQSGKATPAAHVAEVILKAIEAKRPKTRYVTGHLARPVLFLRKILPDRCFDWIVQKFL